MTYEISFCGEICPVPLCRVTGICLSLPNGDTTNIQEIHGQTSGWLVGVHEQMKTRTSPIDSYWGHEHNHWDVAHCMVQQAADAIGSWFWGIQVPSA